jgi:LPS sulfotransferase NodH
MRLNLAENPLVTPLAPNIKATFLIAFTVRCGSNYFCDCLKTAGCGQPTEFFQFPLGIQNKWYYQKVGAAPDDFKTFLPKLIDKFSQNDIFGAKLAWAHRSVLEAAIAKDFPATPTINAAFGQPLWLQMIRRDKIGQTISWWRAIKTGKWLETQEGAAGTQQPPPPYNFAELYHCLSDILCCEYQWTQWFEQSGIKPVVIAYEDFVAQKSETLFQVVQLLQQRIGVERIKSPAEVPVSSKFRVQRDTYSDSLRQQFLADMQTIDVTGHCSSAQVAATGFCA